MEFWDTQACNVFFSWYNTNMGYDLIERVWEEEEWRERGERNNDYTKAGMDNLTFWLGLNTEDQKKIWKAFKNDPVRAEENRKKHKEYYENVTKKKLRQMNCPDGEKCDTCRVIKKIREEPKLPDYCASCKRSYPTEIKTLTLYKKTGEHYCEDCYPPDYCWNCDRNYPEQVKTLTLFKKNGFHYCDECYPE